MSGDRLVYSTDPRLNQRCPRCKLLVVECACRGEAAVPEVVDVVLRVEKAKRGGKIVTVVDGLPAVRDYLKALAKELKQSSGSGGTFGIENEVGFVEIQGERRDALRELLLRKGMRVRG